jgi:hypothetical protein
MVSTGSLIACLREYLMLQSSSEKEKREETEYL